MRVLAFAFALLSAPAIAAEPGIRGTWSADCLKLYELDTFHFEKGGVRVADRVCETVSWRKTSVGWHSALACSTEGYMNTGQILVFAEKDGRLRISMDGVNEVVRRCRR